MNERMRMPGRGSLARSTTTGRCCSTAEAKPTSARAEELLRAANATYAELGIAAR